MTDLSAVAGTLQGAARAESDALSTLGEAEVMAMAQSAPVGLFAGSDPYGTVLANRRFLDIVGLPRRDALGDGWMSAVHPDDLEAVMEAGRQLREHGEADLEHRFVHPDGTIRWARLHVVRVTEHPEHWTFVGSMVDVTEFKAVEEALRESETRFRALVEHSFDIISVLDPQGDVRYTSPSAARITGLPPYVAGNSMFERIHPDDIELVTSKMTEMLDRPGLGPTLDVRIQHADGHWITLEAVGNNLIDDPEIQSLIVFARDVTEERATQAALRVSEALLRDQAAILEMIATSTPLSDTLAEICRLVEAQLTGARCTILLVSDDGTTLRHGAAPSFPHTFVELLDRSPISESSVLCGAAVARAETVSLCNAWELPSPYGDLARDEGIAGAWSTPVLASSDGRVLGTFATYLTESRGPTPAEEAIVESVLQLAAIAIERREFEERLAHQAQHDPLTGLPNRALFGELLDHALARAQRSGCALAVLFLDLDRFKVVNDSLGHDAGDELLHALAHRLHDVLRPGDVVARFGGDEFTVLCEDLEHDSAVMQAVRVAERLIDSVQDPVTIEGDEQFVSASVGIALAVTGKERPDVLLRDADAAMYRAKDRGRGRCEVFDEAMRGQARERHEIENALHRAVTREEFRVFYQPVISLRSGDCIGAEALLRWQHPERGLLLPRDFLDAAEETGLIVPIGAWLLEAACNQAVEWRRAVGDAEVFRLSVNLSGRQLVHSDLADLVAGVIARTGMRPDALCVEITETVLMSDVDAGVAAVKALKALGVCVSIDDFGTGYSALGYLKKFPIDEVKIDRTFVERLGIDPEDSAIVQAVVSLGHSLGHMVTGEGVETDSQLEELRRLKVDAAQGFLFAPAQPASDLTQYVLRPKRWL